MAFRARVDAVPHDAGRAATALPAKDLPADLNGLLALRVVLVAVGDVALSLDQEELADGTAAGEGELFLGLIPGRSRWPDSAGANRRRQGRS
eukprot:15454442-Alexandrium_andersonii.AAC.1